MQLAVCLDKQKNDNTQIDYLKSVNYQLLNSVNNMATLSAQESANLERSLESLSEKERQVRNLQDALNKKDSVMYALVSSLKGEFISADDEDIQIEVEKGAVFVSISDKMLFKSGNADLNKDARAILEKVAKVLNNQPDMEVLVEGHTDNKAFKDGAAIKDNWELSVQRAASVVRVLQNDYNVDPARMIAGGRSYYVPVASNDTKEGRAQNRRIKIIILPKLDQFYGMIEEGME
jgi:chemotaxis protein MotB